MKFKTISFVIIFMILVILYLFVGCGRVENNNTDQTFSGEVQY